jgi:hypothetical protein
MTKEKRSDLINRPDKWTANTEIDFGGGLYGYRVTGSKTVAADTYDQVNITVSGSPIISSYGGYYKTDAGYPLAFPYVDAPSNVVSIIFTDTNHIYIGIRSNRARTNQPYDIWVKYTK